MSISVPSFRKAGPTDLSQAKLSPTQQPQTDKATEIQKILEECKLDLENLNFDEVNNDNQLPVVGVSHCQTGPEPAEESRNKSLLQTPDLNGSIWDEALCRHS